MMNVVAFSLNLIQCTLLAVSDMSPLQFLTILNISNFAFYLFFLLQNLMLCSVSIICQCILMSVFILSVFSCTVLFASISQVIGCEDRLRSDLYCVEWGVKLYSNQPTNHLFFAVMALLARALVDIFVHIFLPVILWQ